VTTIKSYSVGNGDMFCIRHVSDNFTIIDCCLSDDNRKKILDDLQALGQGKGISRFISTHPDQDHISGLVELDKRLPIINFYCVKNEATKSEEAMTADFVRYCELRDDIKKAFHIYKGCSRRWMNKANEERDSAGINILWPSTSNGDFQEALIEAKAGGSPNNISPIIKYSLEKSARVLWMGDLETDFMEGIEEAVEIERVDILFAPHHGRDSGKVPASWLEQLDPQLIVIGEAPSQHLNYYQGYNTITQNSAGDITFECETGWVHIYVSSSTYSVGFLKDERKKSSSGKNYIGSLEVG
jgi:beta-lactamase superfamily II metal-dependent hydrolase